MVLMVLMVLMALMDWAHNNPAHTSELVPPYLPHFYGTVDAAAVGMGGVILPCTRLRCLQTFGRQLKKENSPWLTANSQQTWWGMGSFTRNC